MKPPKDIAPEVLFRTLSKLPRATRVLKYRISSAEDIVLSVRTMSSHEIYSLIDGAKDKAVGIVCATLLADGERAFSCPEEIFKLHKEEVDAIYSEVSVALSEISPLYASIDHVEWMKVLKEGALHQTNVSTTWSMSECVDIVAVGDSTIKLSRPERYYGIPPVELSDGQRLAFSAAREAIDELAKKSEEE